MIALFAVTGMVLTGLGAWIGSLWTMIMGVYVMGCALWVLVRCR